MKKLLFILLCVLIPTCFNLSAQSYHADSSMVIKKISKDKTYGYTEKNTIKVGSIANEYHYLRSLSGPNGEEVEYNRLGSCCIFDSKKGPYGRGLLDQWEITYKGQKEPIILYLNGYEYRTPKCPYGLTIKNPKEKSKLKDYDLIAFIYTYL